MRMYICIYMFETYLHPHLHVLASSQGDMHMYAYIYMDIYIYIYTCICIHTYLFIAKTIPQQEGLHVQWQTQLSVVLHLSTGCTHMLCMTKTTQPKHDRGKWIQKILN